MILPLGPVPLISAKGTPFSNAIFLARGLAKNLGLSPLLGCSGALAGDVWASPEPNFCSPGVPTAGVVEGSDFSLETGFSSLGAASF